MRLDLLPYELLDEILLYLKPSDLLQIRLSCATLYSLSNYHIFYHLKFDEKISYRKELIQRHGKSAKHLELLRVDPFKVDILSIFKVCPNIFNLIIKDVDMDSTLINYFTTNYERIQSVSVTLLDKGLHNRIHKDWLMLSNLKYLKSLELNYVDFQIAETLFYQLPNLHSFQAKLINTEVPNDLVNLYSVDHQVKRNFHNPHLHTLHLESWAKGVELDSQLFYLHPRCFPNLNQLTLVSYQNKTSTWFNYSWPQIKNLYVDYVKSDHEAEALALHLPNLHTFRCLMWSSSGKLLNQLLFQLNHLRTLLIEGSLPKDVLTDLAPAENIMNLQIGIVNFDEISLKLLSLVFPKVRHVHLGHVKSDPNLADTISKVSLTLDWETLRAFQLSPSIGAIAAKCKNLKKVLYDVSSKLYSPLKLSKLIRQDNPNTAVKVLQFVE